MDDVAIQEQLDVAQHLTEQLLCLVGIRAVAAQLRRGIVLVPDVGHEQGAVGSHERSRHVGPGFEQRSEHLPFAIDPDRRRDLLPERRPLLDGDPDPSFLDELAVSVQPFVPERAAIRRVEHLQRGQRLAGRPRVGADQVDDASLPLLIGRMTFSMSPSSKKCSNALSCNGCLLSDVANGYERHVLRSRGAGAEMRVWLWLRGTGGTRRQRDVEHRDRSHTSSLLPSLVCRCATCTRPARIGAGSGRGKRCQTRPIRFVHAEGPVDPRVLGVSPAGVAVGGPLSGLRPVGHHRRGAGRGRGCISLRRHHALSTLASAPDDERRVSTGSPASIACWVAASCRRPWRCSRASPASASPRCSSTCSRIFR